MPSRRQLLTAVSVGGLGALAGCSSRNKVDGRWPRAGYDDGNTGYAPERRGPGATPTVAWSSDVPDGYYSSSPVLYEDRVYIGYATEPYRDGPQEVGLRVLDAGTGDQRRDVTVTSYRGDSTTDALYRDSLVFADGALYLVAFDGLHSLTPSGERRWHRPFGGSPTNSIQRSGHPVVADGTVYAPTASTTWETGATEAVYALDADTGDVAWRYVVPTDSYGWTFPPAYADSVVYVAALQYGVVALDAATGDVLWRTTLPGVAGPPTVAEGRVYVSLDAPEESDRSHVVALSRETGEEVWRTTGSGTWLGRRIAAARGRVYHREHLDEFVARDAATGEEDWRRDEWANVHFGTPAVTDEALYVAVSTGGDDDNGVAVLDPDTGEQRGFGGIGTDGGLNASVALSDGLAVVTSSFGAVYAFESCPLRVAGHCLH